MKRKQVINSDSISERVEKLNVTKKVLLPRRRLMARTKPLHGTRETPLPFLIKWLIGLMIVCGIPCLAFFICTLAPPDEASADTASQIYLLKTTPAELSAWDVANSFIHARSTSEKLQWVVNPKATKQKLSSYPEQAFKTQGMQLSQILNHEDNEDQLFLFKVHVASGAPRSLYLRHTPDGYKVDWDASARYDVASWSDMQQKH